MVPPTEKKVDCCKQLAFFVLCDIILRNNMLGITAMWDLLISHASEDEVQDVPFENFYIFPIRHTELPPHIIIACRLISEIFCGILKFYYNRYVKRFC